MPNLKVDVMLHTRPIHWLYIHFQEARHYCTRPESKKVILLSLFNFLLSLGFTCGFFSANTLLVTRIGTAPLFYVYLIGSLFALGLSGLLYLFAGHRQRKKLSYLTFFVQGVIILCAWLLIKKDLQFSWVYIGIRAFFYAVFVCTSLEFWLLASNFFNNFESKRRFPLLVVASILGCIAGGLLISGLAKILHTPNLILIWGGILILSPLFFLQLEKIPTPADTFTYLPGAEEASAESIENNRDIDLLSPFSGLALLLFIFWVFYSFFCYGIDYVFNSLATSSIPQADELTVFFGKVTTVSNGVLLIYHLFFSSSVLSKHGLGRTVFAIPVLIAISWTLVYFYFSLHSAALAWGTIYFCLEFTAWASLNTVLNVFPHESRGKAQAFAEGAGRPIGTLLLLLIALGTSFALSAQHLSAIMLVGSLLFLLYPFLFHRAYLHHLIACLRSRDLDLVTNAIQALGEPHKAKAVTPLLGLLKNTEAIHLKRNVVLSLGKIQSREALQEIVALFSTSNHALQASVLKALSDYNNYEATLMLLKLIKFNPNLSIESRQNAAILLTKMIGRKMLPFLLDGLLDPDLRIRANAVEAIGLLKYRKMVPVLAPFLTHENHRIKANAAVALYPFRFSRPKLHHKALKAIAELFDSETENAQFAGIYAIGELKLRRFRPRLISLLTSPNKKLLRHLATALAQMKDRIFCETFIRLLLDEDEKFALETAEQIRKFPEFSRWNLFEEISNLSLQTQEKIFQRLESAQIDFLLEKELMRHKNRLNVHDAIFEAI